jgi:predicted acetyltransferase
MLQYNGLDRNGFYEPGFKGEKVMNKQVKKMAASSFEEMYQLVTYAFNFEQTEERRQRFQQISQHSINYGFFIDDQLTGQIMATPFQVNYHNVIYKMAGIGYVASYPEFRGTGGISAIMTTMLKELAEAGYALSYLAPFSYPFYRKYGYEQIFEQAEISLNATDWPYIKRVAGTVKRVPWQQAKEVIKEIYHQVPKLQRGGLVREGWWLDYALNRHTKDHIALYEAPDGIFEGYVKYRIEKGIFEIVEWNYLSQQAFQALAGFIGSHNGSVQSFHWVNGFSGQDMNYLLPTPAAEVKILPYMMARIVELTTFIKEYPFQPGTNERFYLEVTDEYGPWNQGIWQLDINDQGTATLNKVKQLSSDQQTIQVSIQTLTQLLMGYRSSLELAFYGRITGEKTSIAALGKRIAVGQPILEDYF